MVAVMVEGRDSGLTHAIREGYHTSEFGAAVLRAFPKPDNL